MDNPLLLFALAGLLGGVLSGLVGIGGGIVIVPLLVLALGFSQRLAQGTTLAAMVPPIGALAAWAYYRQGQVDVKAATLIALGFVLGGLLGSQLALALPERWLGRVFGLVVIAIGARMLVRAS